MDSLLEFVFTAWFFLAIAFTIIFSIMLIKEDW